MQIYFNNIDLLILYYIIKKLFLKININYMGCGEFFHDKLDELGMLLKGYEKTLDLISREKLPENQKTEYELNNEEKKEQIRVLLDDLNKYFEEEPDDMRFDRFKKLNEKFQYLLLEESNVLREMKEGSKNNIVEENKKGIRFFPS